MVSQTAQMALMNPKRVHHAFAPLASFSVRMGIALTRASFVMATQTAPTIQMRTLLSAVCCCNSGNVELFFFTYFFSSF